MSIIPAPLTLASFAAQRATPFAVTGLDGLVLVLIEAVPLDSRAADAHGFSLTFRGPAQPVLEQATYALAHEALGALAIFLVPVARVGDELHYQAIFN